MKAVLITDVFQSILMFAAIYSIIICAAIHAGGFKSMWDIAEKGGRIDFGRYKKLMKLHKTW